MTSDHCSKIETYAIMNPYQFNKLTRELWDESIASYCNGTPLRALSKYTKLLKSKNSTLEKTSKTACGTNYIQSTPEFSGSFL